MRLIKGDEDNLEGRVVIFTRYIGEDKFAADPRSGLNRAAISKGQIFAVYASSDILDFRAKTGVDIVDIEDLLIKAAEEQQSMHINKELIPFYCASYPASEEEINYGESDILFLGKFHTIHSCIAVLHEGFQIYGLLYIDQMSHKHKFESFKSEEEFITYKDLKKEEIHDHMMKEYVTTLIDASINREQARFEQIQQRFIQFSAGSPFVKDVIKLCELVKSDGKYQRNELLEAYVQKISAIINEDYLLAAQKRDEILQLSKS